MTAGKNPHGQDNSSVINKEIAHFSALARDWWDPRGPMAILHAMNPFRTRWIKDSIPASFLEQNTPARLLDIGCGVGLASEAFATLGFDTLGVDASTETVAAAEEHRRLVPLSSQAAPLRYRAGQAETLVEEGQSFDVVTALEVIEHVRDPQAFLHLLARLTRPGGYVGISTLNRTIRSYLLAKLGAEYLLRLVPVGTHDWRKFIRPEELDRMARATGLRLTRLSGMRYHPTCWQESTDTSTNYIALFARD